MSKFDQTAPLLMHRLMDTFRITLASAAAIAGNAGHESGGFRQLQEIAPVVKNSAGGYGWFQWTGPRRRAFMAWCAKKNLQPASDEANIGFVIVELQGVERAAIKAVEKAEGLYNKVVAFERAYERAGIKHYPSRYSYAVQAQAAYHKAFSA